MEKKVNVLIYIVLFGSLIFSWIARTFFSQLLWDQIFSITFFLLFGLYFLKELALRKKSGGHLGWIITFGIMTIWHFWIVLKVFFF
ncbi:hypothetical protein [Enterococcus timonensis]|uniref:hypothetical protein n=1 Tax=Enterococcus timonensis TaxID=1852364 RepID=UPI0008DA8960|nr:hypothetical protein [Enterococcus timonensis]